MEKFGKFLIFVFLMVGLSALLDNDNDIYTSSYHDTDLNAILSEYAVDYVRDNYLITDIWDEQEIKEEAFDCGWVEEWYDEYYGDGYSSENQVEAYNLDEVIEALQIAYDEGTTPDELYTAINDLYLENRITYETWSKCVDVIDQYSKEQQRDKLNKILSKAGRL